MTGREFQRIPCAVRVTFRSPSAFLVAYATNLSRGGLFLETDEPLEVGEELSLSLEVPELGALDVPARVAWHRAAAGEQGPAGMGIEFGVVEDPVGDVIDRLVASFEGIQVALVSRDGRSSVAVSRAVRAAVATAEVVELSDVELLGAVADSCDLVVIDADSEEDGGDAAVAHVRSLERPLPAIVLSAVEERRRRAEAAGAIALSSPPASGELGKAAVRAMGRPLAFALDRG